MNFIAPSRSHIWPLPAHAITKTDDGDAHLTSTFATSMPESLGRPSGGAGGHFPLPPALASPVPGPQEAFQARIMTIDCDTTVIIHALLQDFPCEARAEHEEAFAMLSLPIRMLPVPASYFAVINKSRAD